MEPGIGTCLIESGQVAVVQVVVDVPQFMMHGHELIRSGLDTLLDAHVLSRVHVPGAGVAYDLAVTRFGQQGSLPEGLRKVGHAQRDEKALCELRHAHRIVVLIDEGLAHIRIRHTGIGLHQVVDIGPLLRPHISEEMGGDGSIGGDFVPSP